MRQEERWCHPNKDCRINCVITPPPPPPFSFCYWVELCSGQVGREDSGLASDHLAGPHSSTTVERKNSLSFSFSFTGFTPLKGCSPQTEAINSAMMRLSLASRRGRGGRGRGEGEGGESGGWGCCRLTRGVFTPTTGAIKKKKNQSGVSNQLSAHLPALARCPFSCHGTLMICSSAFVIISFVFFSSSVLPCATRVSHAVMNAVAMTASHPSPLLHRNQ